METPRRIRVDLFCEAEKAIYGAQQAVERMPASVTLTNAGIKLQEARSLVADFVDDPPINWRYKPVGSPVAKEESEEYYVRWRHIPVHLMHTPLYLISIDHTQVKAKKDANGYDISLAIAKELQMGIMPEHVRIESFQSLTPKTPEREETIKFSFEKDDEGRPIWAKALQQLATRELSKPVVTPNEEEQEEQNKAWLELTEDIGSIRNARFDQWLMVQEKKFKLVRR